MSHEMGFHVIDATLSIEEQQYRMREIVMNVLGESLKTSVLHLPAGGLIPAIGITCLILVLVAVG